MCIYIYVNLSVEPNRETFELLHENRALPALWAGSGDLPKSRNVPLAMLWSVPQGLFFSDKMTSLDILDMYFVKFDDFRQYLVLISFYLFQINEIYFWGC
jgi:hypothetical protein